MSEEELYCHAGDHKWKREVKRGRKPFNCPDHAKKVTKKLPGPQIKNLPVKKANLAKARAAKIEKAKQREAEAKAQTEARLESLKERVAKAQAAEEKAYKKLKTKPTPKNQDEWLKLNEALLKETTALRAHERKAS